MEIFFIYQKILLDLCYFRINYEPIPEIKLGMDNIKISKKLRFSALFSNGILDKNDDFYERPYLHHKYLFFDLGNFEEKNSFFILVCIMPQYGEVQQPYIIIMEI